MTTESASRHRKDAASVILAVVVSLLVAGFIGGGAIFWKQLEQSQKNQDALANQVKALGGTPVVEPKAGAPGSQGPPGVPGRTGATGPPGVRGPQGPPGAAGKNGVTPPCALLLGGCVGPSGKNGTNGQAGTDGVNGKDGQTGPAGPAGADGKPGAAGPQGPAGAAGPTGAQGEPGPTCPTGTVLTKQTVLTVENPGGIAAWICVETAPTARTK
jgi:hypothetical protein